MVYHLIYTQKVFFSSIKSLYHITKSLKPFYINLYVLLNKRITYVHINRTNFLGWYKFLEYYLKE